MRVLVGALGVVALTVLVVSTSPDGTSTGSTVGSIPEPVTTVSASPVLKVAASLPNGTEFLVTIAPPVTDDWLGSTGAIVMDIAGLPASVGTLTFRDEPNTEYEYDEGHYRIPAAGYLVEIDFDEHVLRALGPGAEDVITSSIRGSSEFGFPVLHIDDPFIWGTDEQSPVEMSTRFSHFEVRRGCSDRAVACSPEGTLQVIWRVPNVVSVPPTELPEVRIFKLVP